MHEHQVVGTHCGDSRLDFFHRGHARRENDGFSCVFQRFQQWNIGDAGARYFVGNNTVLLKKLHRGHIPR